MQLIPNHNLNPLAPTPESQTPRTDEFEKSLSPTYGTYALNEWSKHACSLELELAQAKEEVERLENLNYSAHSCGEGCKRPMCVLRRERDELKQQVETLTKQLNQWSNAEILGETGRCELQRLRHQLLTASAHNAKLRGALRCANNSYVGSPDGQKQIDTALALPHDQALDEWVEFVTDLLNYVDRMHWARQDEECQKLVAKARQLLATTTPTAQVAAGDPDTK